MFIGKFLILLAISIVSIARKLGPHVGVTDKEQILKSVVHVLFVSSYGKELMFVNFIYNFSCYVQIKGTVTVPY